jgi:hypothetical protein
MTGQDSLIYAVDDVLWTMRRHESAPFVEDAENLAAGM